MKAECNRSRPGARAIAFAAVLLAAAFAAGAARAQVPDWVNGDKEVVSQYPDYHGSPMNLMLLFESTLPPSTTDSTGEFLEPWTRVHALADYYGLAYLVDLYPHVRLGVCLRPSTLEEIETMVAGYDHWVGAGKPQGPIPGCDRWLRLSLTPVEKMSHEDRLFVAEKFFSVPVADAGKRYAGFQRLLDLRGPATGKSPEAVEAALGDAGLRDLVAWFNLAIVDPDFLSDRVVLQGGDAVDFRSFLTKGQGFTDQEIGAIVEEQFKVLRALIPEFRALHQSGRLEMVTAPYTDAVLPLLLDPSLARKRTHATLPLPPADSVLAPEAQAQLATALAQHRRLFGDTPQAGVWLGGANLEPAVLRLVQAQGFAWAAADDIALRACTKPGTPRVGERRRFALYEAMVGGRRLPLLFKDAEVLDDLEHNYGNVPWLKGANMFMVKLRQQQVLQGDLAPKYVCSLVIPMDRWEEFEGSGKPFLHSVFKQIGESSWIHMVTPSAAFATVKERNLLGTVAASSNVFPLYTSWIGTATQNAAWTALAGLRRSIDRARAGGKDAASIQAAELALRRAEGRETLADLTANAAEASRADAAFRLLVGQGYRALGAAPPATLAKPLGTAAAGTGGARGKGTTGAP